MTRYAPLWLQRANYAAGVDRRQNAALWPLGGTAGCALTPGGGMHVNIAPGQVAVPTRNNTGVALCISDAVEQVQLNAASAQLRHDLVTCHLRANDVDGGQDDDFIFDHVTGASGGGVPATPLGHFKLAEVAVRAGEAAVAAGDITDCRPGGIRPQTAITHLQSRTLDGTFTPNVWHDFYTVALPPGAWLLLCKGYIDVSIPNTSAHNWYFRLFVVPGNEVADETHINWPNGMGGNPKIPFMLLGRVQHLAPRTVHVQVQRSSTTGAQHVSNVRLVATPEALDGIGH